MQTPGWGSTASAARSCHSCGTYTSVNACGRCQRVTTCPQCAQRPEVISRHQQICFSITEPTSVVENVVATAVGGLGPVHQYVTACGWAEAAATLVDMPKQPALTLEARLARAARTFPRLTAETLVAGVIFNDFPVQDELDLPNAYSAKMLAPIAPDSFPAIKDRRFLWQPTEPVRWANAAVYKGVPETLLAFSGVDHATMEQARETLRLRTALERTSYHFMRFSKEESNDDVQDRAIVHVRRWFRLAVLHRTMFPLGHIVHMVEDSFSPAHTMRDLSERGVERPYGVVTSIYFFGEQTDQWHSTRESWSAVNTANSEAERRVKVCAHAVRDVIVRFEAAVAGAPMLPPAGMDYTALPAQREYAKHAAKEFSEFMRTTVFALAPPPHHETPSSIVHL